MRKNTLSKFIGITLLEVLLVLVIAVSILLASFRQYQLFHQDAEMLTIKNNVDQLFEAMYLFYRANCYGVIQPTEPPTFSPGRLNPFAQPTPPQNLVLNIIPDLVTPNYLPTKLPSIFPLNHYVDAKNKLGSYGYIAQFNETIMPRMEHGKQKGYVVLWQAQVAVALKDPELAPQLQAMLNANCMVDTVTSKFIPPCAATSPTVGPAKYLVWERSPAMIAPSISAYWFDNNLANQFRQQYTNNPDLNLPINNDPDLMAKYYLCTGG